MPYNEKAMKRGLNERFQIQQDHQKPCFHEQVLGGVKL